MQTDNSRDLRLMGIIVIICLIIWLAYLAIGYWADDMTSPAADERSVPSPREY
jgi:hypothetical protein